MTEALEKIFGGVVGSSAWRSRLDFEQEAALRELRGLKVELSHFKGKAGSTYTKTKRVGLFIDGWKNKNREGDLLSYSISYYVQFSICIITLKFPFVSLREILCSTCTINLFHIIYKFIPRMYSTNRKTSNSCDGI